MLHYYQLAEYSAREPVNFSTTVYLPIKVGLTVTGFWSNKMEINCSGKAKQPAFVLILSCIHPGFVVVKPFHFTIVIEVEQLGLVCN